MANITLEESVQPPLPTPGRVRLYVDIGGHLVQLDENGAIIDLTESALNPGIGDAPIDGTAYVRLNATWVPESNIVPPVLSVNGEIGNVIIDADDIDDTSTVNKFTTAADIAKLAGIQAGAQVNTVNSVNGATGTIVLDADDINDATTANKFTTAADIAKLAGIQAGAQVNTVTSVAGRTGAIVLVKADVGLGNVDNTSDLNKPISTATQAALNLKIGEAPINGTPYVRKDGEWVADTGASTLITFVNFTAAFTLALADNGKVFVYTGSTNIIVTIPDEVTLNLGAGFNVEFRFNGTGRVTFAGSNIIPPPSNGYVLSNNGKAMLSYPRFVTNQWLLDGDTIVPPPTAWAAMSPVGLNSGNGTPLWREAEYSAGNGRWLASANNGWAAFSDDKGTTWTAFTQNLNSGASNQASRGLQSNNSGVIISLWGNGFASRSTNNGTSFTALTAGLSSGSTTAQWFGCATDGKTVFVAVAQTGYAARSTDSGATWVALTKGLNSGDVNANFNDVESNGSNVMIAVTSTNAGNARSLNNGETWVAMTLNTGISQQANCVTYDPFNKAWYVGCNAGYLLKSIDNGATWATYQQGLGLGFTGNILEADTDNLGRVVVVGTSGFAAYTENDGATWTLLPAYLNSGAAGAIDISAIDNDYRGNWFAVLSDGRSARTVI